MKIVRKSPDFSPGWLTQGEKQNMRKDNNLTIRVASYEKEILKQAAANDNMNTSEWLLSLAYKRINKQKQIEQKKAFKNN